MKGAAVYQSGVLHCRTGSLEKIVKTGRLFKILHCRTGSLEMARFLELSLEPLHCRTGSLETYNQG